jgi:hypothetical protein
MHRIRHANRHLRSWRVVLDARDAACEPAVVTDAHSAVTLFAHPTHPPWWGTRVAPSSDHAAAGSAPAPPPGRYARHPAVHNAEWLWVVLCCVVLRYVAGKTLHTRTQTGRSTGKH